MGRGKIVNFQIYALIRYLQSPGGRSVPQLVSDMGVPFIAEENTPLYVFETNEPWQLLKDYIIDNRYISIYTYPNPLPPSQSTKPLCSTIQMSPIPIPLYAQLKIIGITITMHTSDDDDLESIVF